MSESPNHWSASEQAAALHAGRITAHELLKSHLDEISTSNADINALVTMDVEQALAYADIFDKEIAAGNIRSPLHGITVAVKDTEETAGMLTTSGSPILRNHIPDRDHIVVERLKKAGMIVVGKTNVPEFATGSHTVNPVFGATRNPYDLRLSAGGSSGGSAAALASRMVGVATGSDMGGSLRNPAAFCNVIGLRTSAGRVPAWPSPEAWQRSIVNGPMARTARDTALLLGVMAGQHPRSPISLPGDGSEFYVPLDQEFCGLRVGWSRNLLDLEIDPTITETLEANGVSALREMGAKIDFFEPDLRDMDNVFRVIRGFDLAQNSGEFLSAHRELLGELVSSNLDFGVSVSSSEYGAARIKQTEIYHRMCEYFENIDVLVCPATQVPPFPVEKRYVDEINGVQYSDYLDWMKVAWRVTLTGFVAISIPCGFTSSGLPVGMQIIAPPRQEKLLLQMAHEFEKRRPFSRWAPEMSK